MNIQHEWQWPVTVSGDGSKLVFVNLPGYGDVLVERSAGYYGYVHIDVWELGQYGQRKGVLLRINKRWGGRADDGVPLWDYAEICIGSMTAQVSAVDNFIALLQLAKAQAELLDNEFPAGTEADNAG